MKWANFSYTSFTLSFSEITSKERFKLRGSLTTSGGTQSFIIKCRIKTVIICDFLSHYSRGQGTP